MKLWDNLMEELFFFLYHNLAKNKEDCWALPIYQRKWLIRRFITQKQRENEAIEKAKRQARRR